MTDEELLTRRRLGKTKLTVKPGQIGTSNATKAENLGPFEYAHLRAPLPDDLRGSEIFDSPQNQSHPETYFLMVRGRGIRATPGSNVMAEKEQRRVCQCYRHVQDRLPLGGACRREG
jgi:hypothetical protein